MIPILGVERSETYQERVAVRDLGPLTSIKSSPDHDGRLLSEGEPMKQNGATRNLGVIAVIASVVLGVVAVVAVVQTVNGPDLADASSGPAQVLRSDSHRLDEAPEGRATHVEFHGR